VLKDIWLVPARTSNRHHLLKLVWRYSQSGAQKVASATR
jgi:hypothetical protein